MPWFVEWITLIQMDFLRPQLVRTRWRNGDAEEAFPDGIGPATSVHYPPVTERQYLQTHWIIAPSMPQLGDISREVLEEIQKYM